MSLSFKGHTVVVTGAGGGLGKAYVSCLDTVTFSREPVWLLS
jgi:short-subunit dehydrogenase